MALPLVFRHVRSGLALAAAVGCILIAALLAACAPASPASTATPGSGPPSAATRQPPATAPAANATPTAPPSTPGAAPTAAATTTPTATGRTPTPAPAVPNRRVAVPVEVPAKLAGDVRFGQQQLEVPEGFRVNVFAAGLGAPRFMAFDEEGVVFVSVPRSGTVVALPDRDRDGVADETIVVAENLRQPHGLAFADDGSLYVAETHRVVRLFLDPSSRKAVRQEVIVPELPSGRGHWTRTIGFGPDGKLYVSVGSSCNACVENDDRRAAIVQYDPDGSGERVYASGLRNSVGFVWHPQTGALWATDNGRDYLGDNLPPEEINVIREGQHYGWPYCWGDREPDAEFPRPGFCEQTEPPVVKMPAHSAPLGLAFYTGQQFPSAYQGDLFVAFHGSWNRTERTGYKLVVVPFANGTPGQPEDFATGWLRADGTVWGRPVQPIVAPDGTLLLSDDSAGVIYRFRHAVG